MNQLIKILLVEDSDANSIVVKALLNANGFRDVARAKSGEEALILAASNTYDLVLMDILMPGIDGRETTKQLRQLTERWRTVPILAMTANDAADERQKCIDASMNGFFTKPVHKEELLSLINKTLDGHSNQDQSSELANVVPTETLIDEQVLTALEKSVPPEAAKKMLNAFLLEMNQRIEKSEQCVELLEQDRSDETWLALTREYHTLKSLCGTFAATGMQAISLQLEQSAKNRQLNPHLMQELVESASQVNKFFNSHLNPAE